jgi:ribose transport system permease protein
VTTDQLTATTDVTGPADPAPRSLIREWSRFGLPVLLLAFVVFFSMVRPDTFATTGTIRTVLSTQAVLAILALAAFVTLYIGQFDLSIGYQLGLAAILVPGLTANQGLSLTLAVLLAIGACACVGLINGLLVAVVRVNSFISTIAMGALLYAFILYYTDGAPIFEGVPASLRSIASADILGVPLPPLYVLVLGTALWILVQRTPFGRYMAAVGGSEDAARLAGINTVRVTALSFVLAGALAGCAGALTAAQLGTGNPAVGPGFLLPAFAAAFLGSTCFRVGTFNVWGTLTAVVTIATGVAGLNLLGMPQWVDPAFNGAALLVAVIATRYLRGRAV